MRVRVPAPTLVTPPPTPLNAPAKVVLAPFLAIEALWWSFPISAAVSLLLTIAYYFWGGWRKISLLATMEEAEEFVQSESDPAGRLLPNG